MIMDEAILVGITIVSCSTKTVQNDRSNILQYGTIDARRDTVGRSRKITDENCLAVKAWPTSRESRVSGEPSDGTARVVPSQVPAYGQSTRRLN